MDRIELGLAPAPEGGILSVIGIQPMPEGLLTFQQPLSAPLNTLGPSFNAVDIHGYTTGGEVHLPAWDGSEKTFSDLGHPAAVAFTMYFGIEESLLKVDGAPDLDLVKKIFLAREGRSLEKKIGSIFALQKIAIGSVTSGLRAFGLASEMANLIAGDVFILTSPAVAIDGARALKGDAGDLHTITGIPVSAQFDAGTGVAGPYQVYIAPKPAVFRTDLNLVEGPALKSNRTNYLVEATYVIAFDTTNTYSLEATINA